MLRGCASLILSRVYYQAQLLKVVVPVEGKREGASCAASVTSVYLMARCGRANRFGLPFDVSSSRLQYEYEYNCIPGPKLYYLSYF